MTRDWEHVNFLSEIAMKALPFDTKVSNKESYIEDEVLVRKCQKGELEAFNDLVLKYQERIFNIVIRMVGHWDEACDLTQDIFIKAYQGLPNFQCCSSFFTWLFRIAMNVIISQRRKYTTQKKHISFSLDSKFRDEDESNSMDPIDPAKKPVDEIEWKEKMDFMEKAVLSLDEDFRKVIILRDIEGFSYEEIAEIIGCPIGTVRSRLNRARNMLKEKLQPLF